MKMTLPLLAAAAFAPLPLSAQSPAPAGGGIAASHVAPVSSPAAGKLSSVQFEGANLSEVITYLQAKSKEAGHDPNVDPLNVVISPGLEEQRLPSLSLRNVSPTEVLTVATTVLGLHLDSIAGDNGTTVAWLVKAPEGYGPGAGGVAISPPPGAAAAAVPGDPSGGASASGFPGGALAPPLAGGPGLTGGNPYSVPYAVQIAASPPSVEAGGGGMAPAQPKPRVFGVASLIGPTRGDVAVVTVEERNAQLERLIHSLEKMAADQGGKVQINAYGELDILVVKSADPAVLALIAEAIDAMKSNSKSDNSAQSREEALRAEINALSGQLSIIKTEKEAQRQTLLDQIELLKAGSRGEDAPRPKR